MPGGTHTEILPFNLQDGNDEYEECSDNPSLRSKRLKRSTAGDPVHLEVRDAEAA